MRNFYNLGAAKSVIFAATCMALTPAGMAISGGHGVERGVSVDQYRALYGSEPTGT